MDLLPQEIISHILGFLSVSDRKEAALVCHQWYAASLHPALLKDVVVKCQPSNKSGFQPVGFVKRKLTHLALGEWDSRLVTEENVVSLLKSCSNLIDLDISRCNSLFFSGRLLSNEEDRAMLKESLGNVHTLRLGCLRHMTDVTFLRLVSVMDNLTHISLTSTNMILGSGLYDVNQTSPALFNFSTFIKFLKERADNIKIVDLSYTSVHDDALRSLGAVEGLSLREFYLHGCMDVTDKGLKALVSNQPSLQVLDLTRCKDLGSGQSFFSTLVNNLPKLHTLILRKCVRLGECDIGNISGFASLTTLDLGEVLNLYDKELIKGLCTDKSRLTTLRLPFCTEIHDCFVKKLCETNRNLVHLDLSSCMKLTDASLHTITRHLTSLRSLSVRYCPDITDLGLLGYAPENGAAHSKRHIFEHDHEGCCCTREPESRIFRKPTGAIKEHQTSLSQAQTYLEAGDKEELCMLSDLINLQQLDLSHCPRITDLGIAESLRFRELRALSLSGLPRLTDACLITLAHHNPSLEVLSLQANPAITDVAVEELVTKCRRLRHLDVAQCTALTDLSLVTMETSAKRLRFLDISFCSMTVPAANALEKENPDIKIVFRPHVYMGGRSI